MGDAHTDTAQVAASPTKDITYQRLCINLRCNVNAVSNSSHSFLKWCDIGGGDNGDDHDDDDDHDHDHDDDDAGGDSCAEGGEEAS